MLISKGQNTNLTWHHGGGFVTSHVRISPMALIKHGPTRRYLALPLPKPPHLPSDVSAHSTASSSQSLTRTLCLTMP